MAQPCRDERRRREVAALGLLAVAAGCGADTPSRPPSRPAEGSRRGAPPAPDRVLEMGTGEGPQRIEVYRSPERRRGFLVVGHAPEGWTSPVYPMWKVEPGDVDDDGQDEVLMGIWSHKKRHDEPQPHRTVWVLDWHEGELFERWRGSALARPLVDFEIEAREAGPDHLIAYERLSGLCWRTRYKWNGFGFAGIDKTGVDCGPLEEVTTK